MANLGSSKNDLSHALNVCNAMVGVDGHLLYPIFFCYLKVSLFIAVPSRFSSFRNFRILSGYFFHIQLV